MASRWTDRWTAGSPCGWVLPPSGQLNQQAEKLERAPGPGCVLGRLFVCSRAVGTSSLQGALVPCRGRGCYHPGPTDSPIWSGHPLTVSPHLSSWALGPEDSTLSEGSTARPGADGRLHPAAHGCADPGPSLSALRGWCHSSVCLCAAFSVTPQVTPSSVRVCPLSCPLFNLQSSAPRGPGLGSGGRWHWGPGRVPGDATEGERAPDPSLGMAQLTHPASSPSHQRAHARLFLVPSLCQELHGFCLAPPHSPQSPSHEPHYAPRAQSPAQGSPPEFGVRAHHQGRGLGGLAGTCASVGGTQREGPGGS